MRLHRSDAAELGNVGTRGEVDFDAIVKAG
jgi:hypothetical protein